MKSIVTTFLLVAFLVVGFVYTSPQYSVYNLLNAVAEKDKRTLVQYVDFPSVKESVKAHLAKELMNDPELQDNPFSGLAVLVVDKMVDNLLTPDMILQNVHDNVDENKMQVRKLIKEATFNVEYVNFNTARMNVKNPKTGENIKATLYRDGLKWQVAELGI